MFRALKQSKTRFKNYPSNEHFVLSSNEKSLATESLNRINIMYFIFLFNLSVAKLFSFDDSPKCTFDGQFLNPVFDCFKAKNVRFFYKHFFYWS